MNFLKAVIEEDEPGRRASLLSGEQKASDTANSALTAISKMTGLSIRDLMTAVKKEIVFTAEGILLGQKYPGDPNDEKRANLIVETIIRRRAKMTDENRDPLTEFLYGRGTAVIQSAINAGVSRVAAEAAVLHLVYSERYVPSPTKFGEIIPVEMAPQQQQRARR